MNQDPIPSPEEIKAKICSDVLRLKQSVLQIYAPQLLCENPNAALEATAALCWLIHEYDEHKTVGPTDTVILRKQAFCTTRTISWGGFIMARAKFFSNYISCQPHSDEIAAVLKLHDEIIGKEDVQ